MKDYKQWTRLDQPNTALSQDTRLFENAEGPERCLNDTKRRSSNQKQSIPELQQQEMTMMTIQFFTEPGT